MDLNEKLIAEVSKYDCLYNKNSALYKNFEHKTAIWNKIGEELGLSTHETKKKFKNIRDNYRKCKKNVDTPAKEPISRKPYKYAQCLKFLDDIPTVQNSNSDHIYENSLDVTTDAYSDTEFSYSTKAKKCKKENNEDSSIDPFNVTTSCSAFDSSPDPFGIPTSSAIIEPNNTKNNKTKTKRKTKQKTNCTIQLFQCLANKINESNLTIKQKNDIESSVCKLVYEKIAIFTADFEPSTVF